MQQRAALSTYQFDHPQMHTNKEQALFPHQIPEIMNINVTFRKHIVMVSHQTGNSMMVEKSLPDREKQWDIYLRRIGWNENLKELDWKKLWLY